MSVSSSLESDPTIESEGGHKRERLQGNLSTLQLLIAVLAYNAPLGITAGIVPLVIGYGTGLSTPLLYLGLTAVMLIFAVGYAVMSRVIPRAGAFYTFVTAGLGRPAGLAASFLAIVVYVAGVLYIMLFVGTVTQGFFANTLGIEVPWWAGSVTMAAIVAVLGYLRVDLSVKVIGVLLALELAAVLVYDAAVAFGGVSRGPATSLFEIDPVMGTASGFAIGAIFALTAFGGIETTAIFRDEVRDPKRTVPRATYLAVIIVGVFYTATSWFIIQGIGANSAVATVAASPTTSFYDNVAVYLGFVGRDLVTALLITSSVASLTSMHNVSARYLFNLGADGVLPRALGVPHPRFSSPYRASVLLTVVAFVFLLSVIVLNIDPQVLYVIMTGSTGYALFAVFTLAAIGIAVYLLRTKPEGTTIWSRAIAPIIAAIALLGITVAGTLNLDLITRSPILSLVSVLLVVGCIVLAVVVSLVFRKKKPEVYKRFGTDY